MSPVRINKFDQSSYRETFKVVNQALRDRAELWGYDFFLRSGSYSGFETNIQLQIRLNKGRMTRNDCIALRESIMQSMDNAVEGMGLKVELRSMRYSPAEGTIKTKVRATVIENHKGEKISPEAEAFKQEAQFLGLKETDLGKKFQIRGTQFVLTGLRSGRTKYPILATNLSGRRFKLDLRMVKDALGRR